MLHAKKTFSVVITYHSLSTTWASKRTGQNRPPSDLTSRKVRECFTSLFDFSGSSPEPDATTDASLSWTSSAIPLILKECNTQGHADLPAPPADRADEIQDEGEEKETELKSREERFREGGYKETLANDREVEEKRNAWGGELERFEELNIIVETWEWVRR